MNNLTDDQLSNLIDYPFIIKEEFKKDLKLEEFVKEFVYDDLEPRLSWLLDHHLIYRNSYLIEHKKIVLYTQFKKFNEAIYYKLTFNGISISKEKAVNESDRFMDREIQT